ncbi:helix-turn-helix transcriptional regulator [Spirochaetales bacterium NM-380-WT-3C1]|uniref:Helix-turn-helix transcriptional regulator n=1 Tax=Bullifex porci TaxID=2606638 RepID=A0A7X2PBK7_9SPIO|nr:AraC family transcriptional regulator [Bullifex porci]MSU05847.1 helix-turn-helix transcriptional regulator [Bullifex porci]
MFSIAHLTTSELMPLHLKGKRFRILFNIGGEVSVIFNHKVVQFPKYAILLMDQNDSLQMKFSEKLDRFELSCSVDSIMIASDDNTNLMKCFLEKKYANEIFICPSEEESLLLLSLFSKLESLTDSDEYGSSLYKKLLFTECLLRINIIFNKSSTILSKSNLTLSETLQKIIDYIRSDYWDEITLDSLSIKFRISKNNLCSLFAENLGCSPIQFLINYRLTIAQDLLKTKITTEEVCGEVGFNNYSHFSRTFKKHVGLSPKQYQKKYNLNN